MVGWAGIDAGDKIGAPGAADAIGIDFGRTGVHLDRYHRLTGLLVGNPVPLVTVVTEIRAAASGHSVIQRGGSRGQNMPTLPANAEKSLTLQTAQFSIHAGTSASRLNPKAAIFRSFRVP